MTGRTQDSMSDARLDRLIAQVLDGRGEDVESVALPAREMADRLAEALRPAYLRPLPSRGMRLTLVLMLVVGLLLAAIVAASLIGSRPAVVTPVTTVCGPTPRVPAGTSAEITVVDATGSMTACRGVSQSPPGVPGLVNGEPSILIRADGRWVDLTWVVAHCDGPARLDLSGAFSGQLEIVIAQTRTEPCAPGTALRTIQLEFPEPIARDAISARLTRPAGTP